MMFGWCAPLAEAPALAAAGYDFIEVALSGFRLETSSGFGEAVAAVRAAPIPILAFNTFFPKDMMVVGPEVDEARVKTYLARAADLMSEARARIAVLGSGWSRNAPTGWPAEQAHEQFHTALGWCADALADSGVTLVIEPLNRDESSMINSVAEGVECSAAVNRPEIRVLADFYHMHVENEPLGEVFTHREWLSHVHLADTGRLNPGSGTYDYPLFFGWLKVSGYRGLLSVECLAERTDANLAASLHFLKSEWAAADPHFEGTAP